LHQKIQNRPQKYKNLTIQIHLSYPHLLSRQSRGV
jgi:hypothetical protein